MKALAFYFSSFLRVVHLAPPGSKCKGLRARKCILQVDFFYNKPSPISHTRRCQREAVILFSMTIWGVFFNVKVIWGGSNLAILNLCAGMLRAGPDNTKIRLGKTKPGGGSLKVSPGNLQY